MQIQQHAPLAPVTSFGVGGPAETLLTVTDSSETEQALTELDGRRPWLLGHGTNVLISDDGLPGVTIRFASGRIEHGDDTTLIADAGAAWDDLVQASIKHNLWGLEFTSGVPGSIGAAIFINITAYGQSNSDRLKWVEAVDRITGQLVRLEANQLDWNYKQSIFQADERYIIVRAAYELSKESAGDLSYQSALDVANDIGIKPDTLESRRQIILETRKRAGSLFSYEPGQARTVGSFFRNPVVSPQQAERVVSFDESGKTKDQIAKMNREHGGDDLRVSAAHVLLAAGFKRGQQWGPVRLHPDHVLKIENHGGANAQQIYDVAQEITKTVHNKLGITLEPEAKILGKFETQG